MPRSCGNIAGTMSRCTMVIPQSGPPVAAGHAGACHANWMLTERAVPIEHCLTFASKLDRPSSLSSSKRTPRGEEEHPMMVYAVKVEQKFQKWLASKSSERKSFVTRSQKRVDELMFEVAGAPSAPSHD